MAAITKEELAAGLLAIRNQYSDDPNVDIATARENIANQEAQLISDFVIGRTTNVTGTSVSGGTVTGTGTIQE
ncbi:hypothetical protein MC378_10455 [Polaribacter sp. MSW13]|uniref:Uncharacterized protein n=1 Tax=Polaribacter marinus TaxID=2916838 RepID=A0A9X2AN62_9FLAO|nr:hypothetical protein [Polaribacter marinus]MCI2229589.1 hypothetical protein [Polaribacter marinus]